MWVLEGDTGKVLQGWPIKLPSETRATVLITKLSPGEDSASDIVSDGKHFILPTTRVQLFRGKAQKISVKIDGSFSNICL